MIRGQVDDVVRRYSAGWIFSRTAEVAKQKFSRTRQILRVLVMCVCSPYGSTRHLVDQPNPQWWLPFWDWEQYWTSDFPTTSDRRLIGVGQTWQPIQSIWGAPDKGTWTVAYLTAEARSADA